MSWTMSSVQPHVFNNCKEFMGSGAGCWVRGKCSKNLQRHTGEKSHLAKYSGLEHLSSQHTHLDTPLPATQPMQIIAVPSYAFYQVCVMYELTNFKASLAPVTRSCILRANAVRLAPLLDALYNIKMEPLKVLSLIRRDSTTKQKDSTNDEEIKTILQSIHPSVLFFFFLIFSLFGPCTKHLKVSTK